MADYYPPVGFHFKVEFGVGEGDSDHRFQDVAGLSMNINTEEFMEGGLNTYAHKIPTKVSYGNLVLKRGMLVDSKVIEWVREAIENFEFSPQTITVSLLQDDHRTGLVTWKFNGAYPVKWSISDLKAMESSLVVETLELAYQDFKRV